MIHLAVIGEVLSHSLSPQIHQYLFEKMGIRGTYEKLELTPDEVPHIAEIMREKKLSGVNVTMPYKESVMQYLDVLGEDARAIGAVNTILLKDGKTYGYNSDYIGVCYMFDSQHIKLRGKDIVILGNGGAAHALIYAMKETETKSITVVARSKDKLLKMKEKFPYIKEKTYEETLSGDVIINTTPVGMFPETGKSVVGKEVLRNFKVAGDIVYNPLMTEFLLTAKKEGLKVVTGLSMLVGQAIHSEEIWTGKPIDYSIGMEIHDQLAKKFI